MVSAKNGIPFPNFYSIVSEIIGILYPFSTPAPVIPDQDTKMYYKFFERRNISYSAKLCLVCLMYSKLTMDTCSVSISRVCIFLAQLHWFASKGRGLYIFSKKNNLSNTNNNGQGPHWQNPNLQHHFPIMRIQKNLQGSRKHNLITQTGIENHIISFWINAISLRSHS